jgi:hypothetical protein
MIAMEVGVCYGKSLVVMTLVTCYYGKSVVAIERHQLLWKINGCYGSHWLLLKLNDCFGKSLFAMDVNGC